MKEKIPPVLDKRADETLLSKDVDMLPGNHFAVTHDESLLKEVPYVSVSEL